MNRESGSYGNWYHLGCWRVPSILWMGLPNPESGNEWTVANISKALSKMNEVLFCGYNELPETDKALVATFALRTNVVPALTRIV